MDSARASTVLRGSVSISPSSASPIRVEYGLLEDSGERPVITRSTRLSAVGPFAVTEIVTVDRVTYFCVDQSTGDLLRLYLSKLHFPKGLED